MGSWGYAVMHNDDALDYIGCFVDSNNLSEFTKGFMHDEHYINEFLLAVEIVDISLNGIDMDILGGTYNYDKWFAELSDNPMEELRNDAIHVINFIINTENKSNDWVEEVKEDRKQMLLKIKERLEKEK